MAGIFTSIKGEQWPHEQWDMYVKIFPTPMDPSWGFNMPKKNLGRNLGKQSLKQVEGNLETLVKVYMCGARVDQLP